MSTLSQFSGGGVKPIQTGYVNTVLLTGTGSGEEQYYLDITVSAISDITKCVIQLDGAVNSGGRQYSAYNDGNFLMYIPTAKLVNSTTLRIMSRGNASFLNLVFTGRWTIIEYI